VTKRCTRQSALIAAKNVKFHSSLTELGQFTVESVTQKEDHLDDIKLKSSFNLKGDFLQ
jgi:hypothetical protein